MKVRSGYYVDMFDNIVILYPNNNIEMLNYKDQWMLLTEFSTKTIKGFITDKVFTSYLGPL